MKRNVPIYWICLLLFSFACEQPMDPVVKSVLETKSILSGKTWKLMDYQVSVKNTDIPPPLLLNSSDSLIESGSYNLNDILHSDADILQYLMKFTDNNKILTDSANTGVFVDNGSSYFVWNESKIKLAPAGLGKLNFDYYYNPDDKTMSFTVTEEDASRAIDNATEKLTDWVINETPNQIGDAISAIVFNSEELHNTVNDFVVQAIAGKLDNLTDFDPQSAANNLAGLIMESLDSVDWQGKLSEAINTELQKIISFNPDSLAPLMADEIAKAIQNTFSINNIYDFVLPYMDALDSQDPEILANNISTLIVQALGVVFSEQNLQEKIIPVWEEFTDIDSAQVDVIAGKLAEITEDNWINVDSLSPLFLPFAEKIDETSLIEIGALAQQTTDSLEVLVEKLNSTFNDLNLSPDYDQIETVIKGILLAAKPIISTKGPDEVATEIAQLIIDDFLNTDNIEGAFAAAIYYIQSIDPETAASTIAGWLVNIGQRIGPELTNWLSQKLSPIIQNFDPEYTSFKIAQKVNAFIEEHFTEENIEAKVLPLLQKITSANTEALANLIADKIVNSDLVKESITEENIANILLPVLQKISATDTESVAQTIIDALVSSNVFKSVFTQERISNIIAFLLYKEAYDNFKIAHNFQEATIIISHE